MRNRNKKIAFAIITAVLIFLFCYEIKGKCTVYAQGSYAKTVKKIIKNSSVFRIASNKKSADIVIADKWLKVKQSQVLMVIKKQSLMHWTYIEYKDKQKVFVDWYINDVTIKKRLMYCAKILKGYAN